jgi:hypothetical protein
MRIGSININNVYHNILVHNFNDEIFHRMLDFLLLLIINIISDFFNSFKKHIII